MKIFVFHLDFIILYGNDVVEAVHFESTDIVLYIDRFVHHFEVDENASVSVLFWVTELSRFLRR